MKNRLLRTTLILAALISIVSFSSVHSFASDDPNNPVVVVTDVSENEISYQSTTP